MEDPHGTVCGNPDCRRSPAAERLLRAPSRRAVVRRSGPAVLRSEAGVQRPIGAQRTEESRRTSMLALKYLLILAGVLMLAAALALTLYDLWILYDVRRKLTTGDHPTFADDFQDALPGSDAVTEDPQPIRWRTSLALALAACLPLLLAAGIVVIPAGMGGVRVSQMRGTLPGTLYSGAHFVTPLVESVQIFDLRDHLFTAGVVERAVPTKTPLPSQPLHVQWT